MTSAEIELQALMTEIDRADWLAAGSRLKHLSDDERKSLLALAHQRPTVRHRLARLLGAGPFQATMAHLQQQLSSLASPASPEGPGAQSTTQTLRDLAHRLQALTEALPKAWSPEQATLLQRRLPELEQPTAQALIASAQHDFDQAFSDDSAPSLCLRALARSGSAVPLDPEARRLWHQAFARLIDGGDPHLLRLTARVLQLDALHTGDLDMAAWISQQLQTADPDPRQRILARLEEALFCARAGDHTGARAKANQALTLANEPDLASHAAFVSGEVEWMAGERDRALKTWGGILRKHAQTPTPSGTCRAALAIARTARASGNSAEELAAYRIAAHTAVQLNAEHLVEQAFIGLGRAQIEAGQTQVEEQLLARLGDGPSHQRLRAALQAGVLRTAPEA